MYSLTVALLHAAIFYLISNDYQTSTYLIHRNDQSLKVSLPWNDGATMLVEYPIAVFLQKSPHYLDTDTIAILSPHYR